MKAQTVAAKLQKNSIPIPESGCLVWLGAGERHGKVRVGGKVQLAHRAAYEASRGPIPDGAHVLHKCDVSSCINPNHLYIGDHAQNMRDMKDRKRYKTHPGEKSVLAKLRESDVRYLRRMKGIKTPTELAVEVGCSLANVCNIQAKRSWTCVS